MSFFSFGDLPAIKTRKALILLDFQNDFVRSSGTLHIPNTPEILETLPGLAAAFRKVGDVIWVRSKYESAQSLSDWNFGDRIVLENEPPKRHAIPKSDVIEVGSDRDTPEPVDPEAFLSGQSPTCCASNTSGFQFPAPILAAIDLEQDTVLDKTAYSALESNDLVLSFRTRFVTEVFLCGSLSNISVYATALDAVRNGFSVTLIEDCLGYREFGRHREAMRRMADILGATGLSAQELYQELDWAETDAIAQGVPQPKRPAGASLGLESVMDTLGVAAEESPPEDIPGDNDEDPDASISLTEIASLTRLHRTAAGAARVPADTKKQVRVRVRRPKRREAPPDAGVGTNDAPSKSPPPPDTAGKADPNTNAATSKPPSETGQPTGSGIGEGDSRLVPKLDIPQDTFERIREEVAWQKMYHLSGQVPRLVAVQGHIQPDGSIPIYRHPADESPPLKKFTSAVDEVRSTVEEILGHPLNHVLIQLYRDGQDNISEHSDKTLDIVRGSFICNVSLGAQRVMVLRTKTSAEVQADGESGRTTQRVPLPHRSLFILGEKTNMRWLHGIRPDKRPENTKTPEEKAYGGERISLTFRHIGTYLHPLANLIWGQGAVHKLQANAHATIHGDPEKTESLIRAFGQENRSSEFDWNAVYGSGFDVVNFVTASLVRLTLSGDLVADLRVRLGLSENGYRYEITDKQKADIDITKGEKLPAYVDPHGSTVHGDLAILKHLASQPPENARPGVDVLKGGTHLSWTEDLLEDWRDHHENNPGIAFSGGLRHWERSLEGQHYLGGTVFGIDDCGLWPVLQEIVQTQGPFSARFTNLNQYYLRVEKRGIVRAILDESKPE
ncbi:hypothetical protein N7478_001943 [Penicillium angulare]|uniref:uncharacterized protein n=1 Tax=Penicillium angulare TaxID=116970 RepID=UPI0025425CDE|nr:uncharacterized protein N7478_001943 [Penicillium angulare]KAJ5288913.1 hypothetical protein N7478_001943 [Penicillium angulare]